MLCYSKTRRTTTLWSWWPTSIPTTSRPAGSSCRSQSWASPEDKPYQVHDLLSEAHFLWQGDAQLRRLDPQASPVHILRLRRRLRSEHDFDYFL